MRRTFGKTWWGNAWVEAMERIDYFTNRLPRGRRYANNGNVWSIEIKDGDVFAKVKGSRPTPYNIRINLKKFNKTQTDKIKNLISSNPAIGAELSLGRLPEHLLDILNGQRIHILPQRWDDIDATCSCPDWANPCKHLAAVYYIIANEIDKNPFLLFNLHGVSTESLTGVSGLSLHQSTPEVKEPFIPYKETVYKTDDAYHTSESPDLSFPAFHLERVFSLLVEKPLFYTDSGSFRDMLLNAIKGVCRVIERIEIKEDKLIPCDIEFFLCYKGHSPVFFASPIDKLPHELKGKSVTVNVPFISVDKMVYKRTRCKELSVHDVFDYFSQLPLIYSAQSSPSFRFLSIATSTALAFIKANSFVPEAVVYKKGEFTIRYVPLMHDEKCSEAINYLKSIMPYTMCFRYDDRFIMSKEGVINILSLIITSLFHKYSSLPLWRDRDKIYLTFLKGKVYKPYSFEEQHTANAVSTWLERLSIRKKDISPVIRIDAGVEDSFILSIDVENKKDPLMLPIPLSEVFSAEDTIFSQPAFKVRADVSSQIAIVADYMPALREILNSKGTVSATITSSDLMNFLNNTLDVLNILGIRTVIPKELKKIAHPRLSIKTKVMGEVVSYLSLEGLLDFSWEIAIGDKSISKEEFLKLVNSSTGIVKFKDTYLMLEPEEVQKIIDRLKKPVPRLSSIEVIASAITGEYEGVLFNPDEALRRVLDNIRRVEDIALPSTLNATLRPYQERGFRWLYSNTIKGFGSCIADDMGLGKTIQVITLILKLKEENRLSVPALVICPTTLVGNWQKECERFAPSLKTWLYHGTNRKFHFDGYDILITTYGLLKRNIKRFADRQWSLVVIDEAQNIKNPEADQTKAVKSIKAISYIAMSGTPVENRLSELWSIFDFINNGYLGHLARFKRDFAIPIERYRDRERIERLRLVTSPFLLRRLKTDKAIICDLPEKIVFDEYCYLTKEQTALYKQVVDSAMREIQSSEGIERKGLIFKLITALKQICNHPVHYSKKGMPLKELSGKTEKTIDIIGKIMDMGEKVLIFTQYKEMGELLVRTIEKEFGEKPLFFHGGVQRSKRDKLVEDFQTNPRIKTMILSLKAGGTGLNLTAASNVIHYDLWWNPAVETQATDRTYRIGQEMKVIVHRLITMGTFEEKIDEMIKSKKELADLTISVGEQWITELSDRQLKEIFSLTD